VLQFVGIVVEGTLFTAIWYRIDVTYMCRAWMVMYCSVVL